MCGLFGFCGDPKYMDKNMTKAVVAKIKMLGLYNIDRGKHSCGVMMDGIVQKGIDKEKLFSDFIANNELPNFEGGNYVAIGHTRQATAGAHTEANAHPFVINNNFVLAHNGTLRNIWGLCTKYGVNHSQIHVDSLGLAVLINQEGFRILTEYEGFAALLMTRLSEPNSLYVYRGMCKRTAMGEMEEERPMYYLSTEEGTYFSSLEHSLLAISDTSTDKVKQLEGNIVHKFTNGKMTKSKFPIDRTDKLAYTAPTTGYYSGGGSTYNALPPAKGSGASSTTSETNKVASSTENGTTNSKVGGSSPVRVSDDNRPLIASIWFETLPSRVDKFKLCKGVIWHLGRYWVVDKEEIRMANGVYYINRKGRISERKLKGTTKYFFYEGVMMKNEAAFMKALGDTDLKNDNYNFASYVSKYSDMPVCNTQADATSRCKSTSEWFKIRWYMNQSIMKNESFTPKFSDRNYIIKEGLLNAIGKNSAADKDHCFDKERLTATIKGETPPPAVVIQPTLFKEEEKKEEVVVVEEDWDLGRFYQTWISLEHARSAFSMLEINAMRYYIADVMNHYMQDESIESIYDGNVDIQLNLMLSSCIERGLSVHEDWNDEFPDIIDYLVIARDNPSGRIYDEGEEEDESPKDEVCEFVPKPKEIGEYLTEKEIEAEASNDLPFPDPSDDKSISEKLLETEEKTFMIDEAVKADQFTPSVPKEEETLVEPVEDEDVKRYAFEDVVDYICTVRDNADDLQAIDDEFCQEVAAEVYKTVDPLLYKIREIADNNSEKEALEYIKRTMKKRMTNDTV